jgi:dihydroneopterin aldolase
MTLMLASVLDSAEARMALDGGADIIDVSEPRQGVLGPVALEAIMAVASAVGKTGVISAALGTPPFDDDAVRDQVEAVAAAGVAALRLAADADTLDRIGAVIPALAEKTSLIGVLFADRDPDFGLLERLSALGFRGALLDAAEKGAKRLLDHASPARIEAFCRQCRKLGLAPWLSGSLQSPDIPRLLIVEPDVLGFRSALCFRGRRDGPLDPFRIALVRDLIPRVPPVWSGNGRRRSDAFCSDPAPAGTSSSIVPGSPFRPGSEFDAGAFDTIFVHDFLTTAEVGAYAHERRVKQRLLFNVDAAVTRPVVHADDMRAVVSYDVILDAVRIVVGRGHIDFIETIAEEVAAIVLRRPRVEEVRVRVEKLDVVEGSVGVEIVRRR